MANVKIGGMTPAGRNLLGTDKLEIEDNSGASFYITGTQAIGLVNSGAQLGSSSQVTGFNAAAAAAAPVQFVAGRTGTIVLSESDIANLPGDLASKLNLGGGTMTGSLTLNADATTNLQAATYGQLPGIYGGAPQSPATGASTTYSLTYPLASCYTFAPSAGVGLQVTLVAYDATKVKLGQPIKFFNAGGANSTVQLFDKNGSFIANTSIGPGQSFSATLGVDTVVTQRFGDIAPHNAADFLPIVGGVTMSGQFNLNADATTSLQPVTYQQFQGAIAATMLKSPCYAATTANLVGTYNNGASGVGATFTLTANGVFTTDGRTPDINKRIFVPNQTDITQNGIWVLTTPGTVSTQAVLTRATDYDNSPGGEVVSGTWTTIQDGTTYGGTQFYLSTSGAITIGTTGLVFSQTNSLKPVSPLKQTTPSNLVLDQTLLALLSSQITDSTSFGRALLTAASVAAQRTALSVPSTTLTISPGGRLTGGGDLSANRTLTLNPYDLYSQVITDATTARTLSPSDVGTIFFTNTGSVEVDIDTDANQAIPNGSIFYLHCKGGAGSLLTLGQTNAFISVPGTILNYTKILVSDGGYIAVQKLATNFWKVLGVYEEFTLTTTWTGPWASAQTANVLCIRNMREVKILIPLIQASASLSLSMTNSTVLPTRLRPSVQQYSVYSVIDNGVNSDGKSSVNATGNINFFSGQFANFSGAGNTGTNAGNIQYIL